MNRTKKPTTNHMSKQNKQKKIEKSLLRKGRNRKKVGAFSVLFQVFLDGEVSLIINLKMDRKFAHLQQLASTGQRSGQIMSQSSQPNPSRKK